MSKMGISVVAIILIFIVGGIQQLRINSYQEEAKVLIKEKAQLQLAVKLKESEALSLTAAINKQNKKIKQMQVSSVIEKKAREQNVLEVKFKHQQEFKKLKQGKGPEDMNRWLRQKLK